MAYKKEEHILLLIYKVMDTLSFLPGEALYKLYPERYARLQDTVGGLLSMPIDDLSILFQPVRNHLVREDVFLNNWRVVEGFYVNGAQVTPQVVVDAVRSGSGADVVGCSTLALDIADQNGFSGRLSLSRGLDLDGETIYRTSQLLLYPDYRHAVIIISADAQWYRLGKPNGVSLSAQIGVPHDDIERFGQFHHTFHAILPNILDIPVQQRILTGEL